MGESKRFAGRRIKRFSFPDDTIINCLAGTSRVLDIPEGSTIEGVHYDYNTLNMNIVIANDDFDGVPDGEMIPPIHLRVSKTEWSSDLPTKPGWYWVIGGRSSDEDLVLLEELDNQIVWFPFYDMGPTTDLASIGEWWMGPLDPPKIPKWLQLATRKE